MATRTDHDRTATGFMTVAATEALARSGVRVLDPSSALLSPLVRLEAGVIVYPTVVISCADSSSVQIGVGTTLYPGTVVIARDGGVIRVGQDCELGPGGAIIRAEGSRAHIEIGDEVRLNGGCELTGASTLGRGAQILGAVSARSVHLGGGLGGHRWPVPDERGAVLKGTGIADREELQRGQVKNRRPSFADVPAEWQSAYH